MGHNQTWQYRYSEVTFGGKQDPNSDVWSIVYAVSVYTVLFFTSVDLLAAPFPLRDLVVV
jgi:hypothetical protein